MFVTKKIIRLSETDATGVIYFTNLFKFATEALEEFFETKGINLFKMIQSGDYLFPIVFAKSTYLAPIFLSDEITLTLSLIKMGTSSIEIQTDISKAISLVGRVEIVHVVTSKTTMKKMPIPEQLRAQLDKLVNTK